MKSGPFRATGSFLSREKIDGNDSSFRMTDRCRRENKQNTSCKEVAEASMQRAALEEVTLKNSSVVVISGDRTWNPRGYSSCVGVCVVIRDRTGKVVDGCLLTVRDATLGYKKNGHLLTKSGKFFTLKNV
ncbi:hypothetical protein TNCV_3318121 [Trichonephila clavipes]|nr:hypothetical protein TNCV_3318121 [Trichonephila clavipes]